MTKAGKNPVLDVLDPKVPVDAKVLQNAINGNKKTGKKGDVDNVFLETGGEIGNKAIKKAGKGNNRDKAAVEAGVITKKGGKGVNRGKSGDNLGDEKQKERKRKGVFDNKFSLTRKPVNKVERNDKNGQKINKVHFREFKEFRIAEVKNQGSKEKKT